MYKHEIMLRNELMINAGKKIRDIKRVETSFVLKLSDAGLIINIVISDIIGML